MKWPGVGDWWWATCPDPLACGVCGMWACARFLPCCSVCCYLIDGLLSCMVLAASNPPKTWGLSSFASAQKGCLVGCDLVARGRVSLQSAVNQPCCWRWHPACETLSSGCLSTAWWAVSGAPGCLQTADIAFPCQLKKPTWVCMFSCKGLGRYGSCISVELDALVSLGHLRDQLATTLATWGACGQGLSRALLHLGPASWLANTARGVGDRLCVQHASPARVCVPVCACVLAQGRCSQHLRKVVSATTVWELCLSHKSLLLSELAALVWTLQVMHA